MNNGDIYRDEATEYDYNDASNKDVKKMLKIINMTKLIMVKLWKMNTMVMMLYMTKHDQKMLKFINREAEHDDDDDINDQGNTSDNDDETEYGHNDAVSNIMKHMMTVTIKMMQ